MSSKVKKVVGASAIGAISILEALHLQQAYATPVSFTGSSVANPHGGSVQVSITVDGASGTYRIVSVSTPVQPTGSNASYASFAIPTLTSEALAAQSAAINGVSGASQISAAWKSSLSSAIAAAAAGGSAVGTSSAPPPPPPAPTPTSSATAPAPTPGAPTPVSTDTSAPSGGGTPALPSGPQYTPPVVVPSGIPSSVGNPPNFSPLILPPFSAGPTVTVPVPVPASGPNLNGYLAQLSAAIAQLPTRFGENSNAGPAVTAAKNALAALQAQIQKDASQPQSTPSSPATPSTPSSSGGEATYIANMNASVAFVISQANQAISDYYSKVEAAAIKLYADAQASAAAIVASPAPTVTVTATATATPIPTPTPTASKSSTSEATSASFAIVIKPGNVIKKGYTCIKTVNGKVTKKVLQGIITKCPSGFSLLKK